ncbi:MAG: DegT/DnrJ/EryC1/StrS aminotransferase family protein [Firmicutes bacterium]|nr:DegT/DnrJ/EryC1/StrS aminotransferase family protein [Bacillota bacterium]
MPVHWKVPFFDLNIGKEEIKAVQSVLKNKWISMGETTQQFEKEFAQRLKVKHALAVSSCTSALHLAVLVCGIGTGDEVIVPSLTFVASVNAIRYTGAVPVFADIESLQSPLISPEEIKKKITKKTKGILVVHYAGYPCKMEEILKIAREYQLKLIEDSAHSPFVKYKGKYLGTYGDTGCFSFFSNKNLTTAEGGMLAAHEDSLAEKAKLLRSHGMTTLSFERAKGHASSYDVVALGYNYRIDDIRSAIGLAQLEKFQNAQEKRAALIAEYKHLLSQIKGIEIPFLKEKVTAFHLLPILVDKRRRDSIREYLHKKGIQTSVHYQPVHQFKIYKNLNKNKGLPITEEYASRVISLPLYPSMRMNQVRLVAEELDRALT